MCWSTYRAVYRPTRAERLATPDVRIGDAERDETISALSRHTGDGRLTLDEFEERVGEALRAVTLDDLRHVLRELPSPVSGDVRGSQPVKSPQRRAPRSRVGVPPPVLVVVLVVAGSVVLGHFAWWLIPIGFWITGGCAGRGHGARSGRKDVARV